MKVRPDHYQKMLENLRAVDKATIIQHARVVLHSGKFKDYQKCMRWHMVRLACLTPFIADTLYQYCNDDHIDTALRQAMLELEYDDLFTSIQGDYHGKTAEEIKE